MRKMLLITVLGVSAILFVEYHLQQKKNKTTITHTVSSVQPLVQVDKKADLPFAKKDIEAKELDKSLNLQDIDKKIKLYNKELSRFASLNFEEFSEKQLKLFSQLNIERAALLRQKVLLKYRKL